MDRLGGLVVIVPARRAGDPGSNPGLKLLIYNSVFSTIVNIKPINIMTGQIPFCV